MLCNNRNLLSCYTGSESTKVEVIDDLNSDDSEFESEHSSEESDHAAPEVDRLKAKVKYMC